MKTAFLLINLGTPKSPAPRDVKKYLHEFLLDPKIIDSPWFIRQLIVRGVIVPKRYKQSALSYRKIWTDKGSPLMHYTQLLAENLRSRFHDKYTVEWAMRYQQPSIYTALHKLRDEGIERIILLPLFPQYAEATSGSIIDKIKQIMNGWDNPISLDVIEQFATMPEMIQTFANHTGDITQYDHLLLSFHGLPQKQIRKADKTGTCLCSPNCCKTRPINSNCYRAHCFQTANAIVEALHLKEGQYTLCFQSRLGRQEWLRPYASEVIQKLLKQGVKKLLVLSPSFVCDCLETIFEIGIEYKEEFINGGGEKFDLVPSLNNDPIWIEGLARLLEEKATEQPLQLVASHHHA